MIERIEIPIDFDDDIEIELDYVELNSASPAESVFIDLDFPEIELELFNEPEIIEIPLDFLDMVEIEIKGDFYMFQDETIFLLDRMIVQPDKERLLLIDQTIKQLKRRKVWKKLDALQVRAAHNEQVALLDWVADRQAVTVNSPVFEIDRGFTGNGSNAYIDTNYNPAAYGNKYQLSNAGWGIYRRTSTNNLAHFMAGVYESTKRIYFRWMTTGEDLILFNSSSFVFPFPVTPSPHTGWRIFTRNNASNINDYINKTLLTNRNLAETGIPNGNFYEHAINNSGVPQSPSNTQISIFFAGEYLTQQNVNDLVDIMENYLDAIGAGVIA